jgi:hypothetical protein
MDTPVKVLNKEERENVLLVLNEFSEEYKGNSKSIAALITSVKELSEKITSMLERLENSTLENDDPSKLEKLISNGMEKIRAAVKNDALPGNALTELSQQIAQNILLLKNPVPQKNIHHHHVPKISWIAAGLIIALAIVTSGWYMAIAKSNEYIASDTKYRYLKLDTANFYLQKLLSRTDSLNHKNENMREVVIEMEEKYRNNFEILQRAQRMNAEAENLKASAKKLKEQVGKRKN